MSERNFETIVEGGYYKGKDGEVVGPAVRTDDYYLPWKVGEYSYTKDGFFYHDKRGCEYNLIARVNPDGSPWVEPVEPATEPEKRLPQLGEAWLTRDGLVAHVARAVSDDTYTLGGERPCDLVEYIGPIGQQASCETAVSSDDVVTQPRHYKCHPSGVECIQITEHLNFCRGNAVKYIWRAGEKGNEIVDLQKARWYIDREIKRLGGE